MAILSCFQCQILVNGVALPEYDDDNDATERTPNQPGLTSVNYVEAISGAEFSVKYGLLSGWTLKEDLVWKIYLDGKHSQSKVKKTAMLVPGAISWVEEGVKVRISDDWYLRKYGFADIVLGKLQCMLHFCRRLGRLNSLGEVANHLSPGEMKTKYSGLGKIRVEAWSYKFDHDYDDEESSSGVRDTGLGIVPEKALKGQALSLSTRSIPTSQTSAHADNF
jgi:hypothetical protein